MQIKEHIMKSRNIEHINHAVVVLRHFIELSSKLLPFLDELNNKRFLTDTDIRDREKIIDAFRSYHFDPDTSQALMGSPVLDLIRTNFERLIVKKNNGKHMNEFQAEMHRLRKNWQLIDVN